MVAGGGFAAVEAVLALNATLGPRADVILVSPRTTLDFRPAATIESFADVVPLRYDLRAIAEDLGATFREDSLAAVAAEARLVRLRSFKRLRYDALVLAVGTQPRASVAGALTFRDQRDVPHLRRTIAELESGTIRRLVFAAPAGVSWPLPLYELAAAGRRPRRGARHRCRGRAGDAGTHAARGSRRRGERARRRPARRSRSAFPRADDPGGGAARGPARAGILGLDAGRPRDRRAGAARTTDRRRTPAAGAASCRSTGWDASRA